MYRKELRHIKEMEDQKQAVGKMSNYPVVKDTWRKMSEVYQRGKEGSRILRFCGEVAESSANLAYRASQPVIEKLPVGLMNDYAVTKLEFIEEKYPVIAKPTEEVVDAVKTFSCGKLEEAKTYSTDQFNRFAEITRLDALIGVADTVVDTVLPPVLPKDGEEPSTTASVTPAATAPEPFTRLRMLSDKVKRRAYDNAMAKAGCLKTRSEETISQLVHTVDLIKFAQHLGTFDDAKKKMVSVYEEVMADESEDEELAPDASLERKVIATARIITRRVRHSLVILRNLATDIHVSEQTRDRITSVFDSAEIFIRQYILKMVQSRITEIQSMQSRMFNIRTPMRLVHRASDQSLSSTYPPAPSAADIAGQDDAPVTDGVPGDSLLNSTQGTVESYSSDEDEDDSI